MRSDTTPMTLDEPLMTFDDRVRAVAALGLTPRQGAFLVTVALHGGYCLRRQYAAFAGVAYGQVVRDFFDLLVARDLATAVVFQPNRGRVYHLHAKSLYRSLGQPDNRNRRAATPLQIARKLMLLDYVLATSVLSRDTGVALPHDAVQVRDWLATEQDKVAFFTTLAGVARAHLPQRQFESGAHGRPTVRYFIDKLPIALDADAGDRAAHGAADGADPPAEGRPRSTVRFVYLVHDTTGAGFRRFLDDHLRLLSRLSSWTLVAVCPPHFDGWAACQRVFANTFAAPNRTNLGIDDIDIEDLRWFFKTRQIVDRGDLRGLSVADLDRFRESRKRFTTDPIAQLHTAWQRHGDAVFDEVNARPAIPSASPEQLTRYSLPFRYAQFGTLPGVA